MFFLSHYLLLDYSKRRRLEPTEGEVYHSSRRRKSYDNGQRRSRRYYKEVREDDEVY